MALTKDEVQNIAKLARLGVTEEEIKSLATDLSNVQELVGELSALDMKEVEPLYHVLPIKNVVRSDKTKDECVRDDLLQGAPEAKPPFFSVPKVLDQ
jgi:aspartyl-tRNA(Asn)/glutamyl-tRNA(Gln) amidotransferase subunit C